MYRFKAHYNDGTHQEGGNYQEIDRSKLVAFELFNIETGNTAIKVNFLPGQKLIWRKREELRGDGQRKTVHLIGKQEVINGENKQGLALLFEDGSVELFERFDPTHPFLREVELLEEEK